MNKPLLPNVVCRELKVSRETLLRWTDQGILRADRDNPLGWRFYNKHEVDRLKSKIRKEKKIGESLLVTA